MGFVGETEKNIDVFGVNFGDFPIWNVHEFFDKYKKELLLSEGAVEDNANFIVARLGELKEMESKFMISYKKKSYENKKEAGKDSVLN
jgi:hypothetical protein